MRKHYKLLIRNLFKINCTLGYLVKLKAILLLLIVFPNTIYAQNKQELLADSLSILKEYEQAIGIYEKLLKNNTSPKDSTDFLRLSTSLAINHQKNRNPEASIPILEKAIAQTKDKIEPDSIFALAYHKLGVGYYSMTNDSSAIQYWKKALTHRKNIFSPNHMDIIKGNRNIGTSYINLSDYKEANYYLSQSLDAHLSSPTKDSILLGRTYRDLAIINSELEDFEKAEKFLKVAKEYFELFFIDEPWVVAEVYELFFELRNRQGDIEEMKYYANRELEIYQGFDDMYEEDEYFIANANHNLGTAYQEEKQYDLAVEFYSKAIEINQKYKDNRLLSLADTHNNLASLYTESKEFDKGLKSADIAINLFRQLEDDVLLASTLDNKAELLLGKKEVLLAKKNIDEAIKIIDTEAYRLTYKPLLATFLFDKIRILEALSKKEKKINYLIQAAATGKQVVEIINEIRGDFQSDVSKSFLSKKAKTIFEKIIQIYFDLHEKTKEVQHLATAFEYVERSKALILLEAVTEAENRQQAGIPVDLGEKENTIKKEIIAIEKKLFQQEKKDTDLQNQLIALNRDLEILKDSLQKNFPEYFYSKYESLNISVLEIQTKLDDKTLIEYLVGDSVIYVFVLQKNSLHGFQIQKDFGLNEQVKKLRESISNAKTKNIRSDASIATEAKRFTEAAYQLYTFLFEPILKETKLTNQIVISTDGVLGYIPFDLLLQEKPTEAILFGSHPYLIKDYEISYTYSGSYLYQVHQKDTKKANKTFMALAPKFTNNNAIKLSPLSYNVPEAQHLQELVGGDLLTNEKATKSSFIEQASEYQILHLATHGKANDEQGDYAFLAFTATPEKENQLLYNLDLYNLDLVADMVVLSACETGIGELQKGEGIISLARGFSYAGAKSIITTLWTINDEKTKELMETFYKNLMDGKSKSNALRQSKLDFIKKNSHNAHPYYWAAFIPIGDMQAIDIQQEFPLWGYGFGGLFLILLFLLFFRKQR